MAAHPRITYLDHIDHDGRVATVELRTFRNWPAIGYASVGLPMATLAGILAGPPFWWFAWVPFAGLLATSARQYVTVSATEVDLHNVVRRRRVALGQVDHLSVHHSIWGGWRIRLHCGADQVDTYRFFEAIDFQLFGLGAFAAPPPAAPAALKEVYAFLADRIARGPAI